MSVIVGECEVIANNEITTNLASLSSSEVYLELSGISVMELFCEKTSTVDVQLGSKYVYFLSKQNNSILQQMQVKLLAIQEISWPNYLGSSWQKIQNNNVNSL